MRSDLDDPKLTAYALGELCGQEAEEIERRIAQNPEVKKYVEGIQSTAKLLTEELGKEEKPRLERAQRLKLLEETKRKSIGWFRWNWKWALSAAVGTSFVFVVASLRPRSMPELSSSLVRRMSEVAAVYEVEPSRSGDDETFNTENYSYYEENPIVGVEDQPLSTFSIDVDTASYANVRRFLTASERPPKDAVRIEELINYFKYDYAVPTDDKPFAVNIEMATSPWNRKAKLVRIALKGFDVPADKRPPSNLVFLIDVSGSMEDTNKLPLVQRSLGMLVDRMRPEDRIALAVYAGASGIVLNSTSGVEKAKIREAIERLVAGGSTNGAAGIETAYGVAVANFIEGGINRVILATDGDFNVGVTSEGDLVRLIEGKARTGVFLSVLGFGMGNLKDSNMQKLADRGNGNYAYIDTLQEARKVLIEQAGGTLQTIAKDVKIQVEFNPARVSQYRLIGYEKRRLNNQDFNDDTKDAGEIGAGHTVTAFYEVFPPEEGRETGIDPLKYQVPLARRRDLGTELLTLKLRYKRAGSDESELIEIPVADTNSEFAEASSDFKFAACVAGFGMILKESKYKGDANLDQVLEIAASNIKVNGREDSYRKEFVELVKIARSLKQTQVDH